MRGRFSFAFISGGGTAYRALILPQQLRQLGDIRRDPPRFIAPRAAPRPDAQKR
jgi:hypothetical protein